MPKKCPWCCAELPAGARLCKECSQFTSWRYYALPGIRRLGVALLIPMVLLLAGNMVTSSMERAALEEARRKQANEAMQDLVDAVRAYRAGGVKLDMACVGRTKHCRQNLAEAVAEMDAAFGAIGQSLAPFDHYMYELGETESVFADTWLRCHVAPYFGAVEGVTWFDSYWKLTLDTFELLDRCTHEAASDEEVHACHQMAHTDLKTIYWYVHSGRCVDDGLEADGDPNRSLSWFQREVHRQIYGVTPPPYPGGESLAPCARQPCGELVAGLQLRGRYAAGGSGDGGG